MIAMGRTIEHAQSEEINRYVTACREAAINKHLRAHLQESPLWSKNYEDALAARYRHWHYLAHIRYQALRRLRGER